MMASFSRNVFRGLVENEEGPAQVGSDNLVEGFDAALGEGERGMMPDAKDHDVELSKGLNGLFEELLDILTRTWQRRPGWRGRVTLKLVISFTTSSVL